MYHTIILPSATMVLSYVTLATLKRASVYFLWTQCVQVTTENNALRKARDIHPKIDFSQGKYGFN